MKAGLTIIADGDTTIQQFPRGKLVSAGARAVSATSRSSTSKIKLNQFSPMSKRIMKDAYAYLRVQLATVDSFPVERSKFVDDCLQQYSSLSSTSPDFKQHILMADEENKEAYTAYVSFIIVVTAFAHQNLGALESCCSNEG